MKYLGLTITLIMAFTISIIAGAVMNGCGGSGSPSATYDSGGENGTVAVYLIDGPADDYDHIWVYIYKALLLPCDDGEPIVLFESEDGSPLRRDLLDLYPDDEEDAGELLAVKDVPAGEYSKIRLVVEKYVEGETVSDEEPSIIDVFKLSSGKIDLNPQGCFYVEPDTILEITADIDCDKSMHISGNSKNFRPVVFVDINTVGHPDRCPRVIMGTIETLIEEGEPGEVTGFTMFLESGGDPVTVIVDNYTTIIDDEGELISADELESGNTVYVRGRLEEGNIVASMVVVGDITRYNGIVTTPVVDGEFGLDTTPVSDTEDLTVELIIGDDDSTKTLILLGCDTYLDADAIVPGMRARVFGKEIEGSVVAVAVLLSPLRIEGDLTVMEEVDDGYLMNIDVDPGEEGDSGVSVFLPEGTAIHIKNDGPIEASKLADLVECQSRSVEIPVAFFEEEEEYLTARSMIVIPEILEEVVVIDVDADIRHIYFDMGSGATETILVAGNAPIIDLGADAPEDYVVDLEDVFAEDVLTVYGLTNCPLDSDIVFYSTLMLIMDEED